jgi:hypothetical protein
MMMMMIIIVITLFKPWTYMC